MLLTLLFILIAPVLLIVGLLIFTEKRARQRFHTKDGRLMPGPSIFEAFSRMIQTPNFIKSQVERKQKYGNVYCGFLGTFPIIFIQDAETVKKVMLDNQFAKAKFSTEFGDKFTGKNVLNLNGEEWKKIRVMMNPAFAKLDDVLLDKFVVKTRETLNIVDTQMAQDPSGGVDVVPLLQEMTLDIIGLTAFNYDFRSLSKAGSTKEVESYHFLFGYIFNIFHLLIPRFLSLPTAKNIAAKKHLTIFNGLIKDMIVKSKERIAKEHSPTCLLDMMTAYTDEETGQKLSDEELRANTVILFTAGHETTANALGFAFYVLAKYPEIQQKLYEEVAKHTKHITSDSQIDCETVNNIEYLNYFIKETMRMHPPVTQLPMRTTTTKDEIIDGFTVPKGSNVAVNIYNLHHDERYWKDPYTFDPYRWTPENSQGRPFYAYLPFGGGPRTCIGNNFSLLEQRVFLTMLMREYKVEFADPNYKLAVSSTAIIATPLNMKIKLTKRQ